MMHLDIFVVIGGLIVLWLANMADRNFSKGKGKTSKMFASFVYLLTFLFFFKLLTDGLALIVSKFGAQDAMVWTKTPRCFQ